MVVPLCPRGGDRSGMRRHHACDRSFAQHAQILARLSEPPAPHWLGCAAALAGNIIAATAAQRKTPRQTGVKRAILQIRSQPIAFRTPSLALSQKGRPAVPALFLTWASRGARPPPRSARLA